ncbi:hypothetical protein MCETARE7_01201 [Candidatus Nanopelagicaceae bacterium]
MIQKPNQILCQLCAKAFQIEPNLSYMNLIAPNSLGRTISLLADSPEKHELLSQTQGESHLRPAKSGGAR